MSFDGDKRPPDWLMGRNFVRTLGFTICNGMDSTQFAALAEVKLAIFQMVSLLLTLLSIRIFVMRPVGLTALKAYLIPLALQNLHRVYLYILRLLSY